MELSLLTVSILLFLLKEWGILTSYLFGHTYSDEDPFSLDLYCEIWILIK